MKCNYKYNGRIISEAELNKELANNSVMSGSLNNDINVSSSKKLSSLSDLDNVFRARVIDNNKDEKAVMTDIIGRMKNLQKNNKKQVISYGNNVLNFSEIPEYRWEQEVKEKLFNEFDIDDSKIKNIMIDFLNDTSLTKEKLNKLTKNENELYGYEEIEAIRAAFNWRSGNKYLLLQDAISQGLISANTQILGNYNPLIGIRYEANNKMLIDIFAPTRNSLSKIDDLSKKGLNIFSKFTSGKDAFSNNITLSNNFVSRNTLLLNLTANILANQNDNVVIGDTSMVKISPFGPNINSKIQVAMVDHVVAKSNMKSMLKYSSFTDNIDKELLYLFASDNFEKATSQDYVDFLSAFYNSKVDETNMTDKENFWIKHHANYFEQGILDKKEMLKKIGSRINYLLSHDLSSNDVNIELDFLRNLARSLMQLPSFSHQLNNRDDIDFIKKNITNMTDIGNEYVQEAHAIVDKSSRAIVTKMHALNKEFSSFYDIHKDNYLNNKVNTQFLKNPNFKMYDSSYATVIDVNGKTRFAGQLLWTTDINEDPLFAKQAQEKLNSGQITQKVLDANRWYVNQITDRYVRMIMHKHEMSFGSLYDIKEKRTLTKEDFKKKLFTESSYRQGMIPIIPKRISEKFFEGDFKNATKDAFNKTNREEDISYLLSVKEKDDKYFIDKMDDIFMDQISYGSTSIRNANQLGSKDFMNKIGLSETYDMNGVMTVETIDIDGSLNNGFTRSLQDAFKVFMLIGERKIEYESNALPYLNSMFVELKLKQETKGMNAEPVIDLITSYLNQSVKNETQHWEKNPVLEKSITTLTKFATAKTMAFNLNIAQMSALANFNGAILEALSNSATNHYNFGINELSKASVMFFSDYSKMTELAYRFKAINASEMESVSHFYRSYKGNKQLTSNFLLTLPNWATDFMARTIIVGAQMMKDGTYDAYTINENGEAIYDQKKDKRWDGEEGKARYEFVKDRMRIDGIVINEDGSLPDAYIVEEQENLKWLSDRYVAGTYDPVSMTLLGSTVLGKQFKVFRTWMTSKLNVIYSEKQFVNKGGRLVMVKDENGNYLGKWERKQLEGWSNTWARLMGEAVKARSLTPFQWSRLNQDEKQNIARGGLTVSMFLFMTLLAQALIDDDDNDPLDLVDKKTGRKKHVPGIRFYKNFQYSLSSLLLVEDVFQFFANPFVGFNILKRSFVDYQGNIDISNLIEKPNIYKNVTAPYEALYFAINADSMRERQLELREQEKEERRQKRKEQKQIENDTN